jgi:hypothetical protein
MGLFKLFSRKHSNVEQVSAEDSHKVRQKKESKHPARLNTQEERISYIKDNCEIILDNGRQIEEAKVEYQAVTSYLTDMQKIDLIPLEERGPLEEAAGKIASLSKERSKLQSKSSILTDKQYKMLEQYEDQLPKELATLKENEEYKLIIEQDMNHLEKERKKLDHEEAEIIGKQAFLKGIAITVIIVIVFLFTLFAMLSGNSEANYTWPFILTVVMGMAAAYYIFMESRKNHADVRLVQMKQGRQIMLMNKVKIKSVNNLNYIDYAYQKYMVNNHGQLQMLWYEYIKVKEETKRYQRNSDALDDNNHALFKELKKFGIADAEVWIYQPNAILDEKEMVEVRHRLNVRRQKLRERIDINGKQREEALKEINKTMKNYPDCILDAEKLLRKFRIETEE